MSLRPDELREVLGAVPDATISLTHEGTMVTLSRQACALFDYEPEEIEQGASFTVFVPERWRDEYLAEFRSILQRPDTHPTGPGMRLFGRRKGGAEFPVEVKLSFATLENTPIVLASLRDITKQETLWELLQEARRMNSVGPFASAVSHEFNNLLTVILCGCRLLQDQSADTDTGSTRLLADIHTAATQASALMKEFLPQKQLPGETPASPRPRGQAPDGCNINDVIERIRDALASLAGADVRFETRLASDLGHVEAELGEMEQVLLNLIGNAGEAMPGGGHLVIETKNVDRRRGAGTDQAADQATVQATDVEASPFVMLTVEDDGIGMDPEALEKAFDPFFTTRGKGEVTGLGLVMVRSIVESSGGFIEVKSSPGAGSRFDVFLPRQPATAPVGGPVTIPRPTRGRGETVLLVEDSRETRSTLARILEGHGLHVLEAAHPDDAMRLANQRAVRIDLLVVEVVLPQLPGPLLVERLQRSQPHARVLFVSGHDDPVLLEHGAHELETVLRKPFEPDDLLSRIRDLLGSNA